MSTPLLVETRGLGKSYPLVFRSRDRVRALYHLLIGRERADDITVLRDVNLQVAPGQSLGLIGENGAGKSTLLKLLTGVLTPTSGSVVVNGRVGALLELGAGFHPEYSGRDNIAMSAALYGLSEEETRAKLPEIVEFADIGRYIDEPVKHYSSGMVVRLGFSVIAALKPDLLITDEVLAVGDESFQKKCVHWIEEFIEGGGTLILVSHSMYHVQKLCRQACWIKQGRIEASGDVFDVTQAYLAYQERKSGRETSQSRRVEVAGQNLEFYLLELTANDSSAETPLVLSQGDDLQLRVRVHSRDGREPTVAFGISRADGTPVYGVGSDMDGARVQRESGNVYSTEITFSEIALLPGSYVLKAYPMDPEAMRLFDTMERGLVIRGESREFGMVRLQHRWKAG
ncbi:MAG: ABC transporter ATP-binding protein [Rudaea sp.]